MKNVIEDQIEYKQDKATHKILAFLAGYAFHSVIKNSKKCMSSFSSLTIESFLEFDEAGTTTYLLIQLTVLRSLKYPFGT